MAMVTTFGRRLAPAIALVLTACAAPTVVVTPPAPGVPHISALTVEPGRLESGCPITFGLTFEDAERDVTRAVARWWARTSYSRYDEGTDVRLARREEAEVRATLGDTYARYAAVTPAFIPRVKRTTRGSVDRYQSVPSMITVSETVEIEAPAARVFAHVDDIRSLGSHMTKRSSMAMMGSRPRLEILSDQATGLGATYRYSGTMMGLSIDFSESVTKYVLPREKVWARSASAGC